MEIKVSGEIKIDEKRFKGPERVIKSKPDIWRFIKEVEGTILAELGIDSYDYEVSVNPQYMSLPEAAHLWGIKRNTLVAAVTRGRFDSVGGVRTFKPENGRTIHYISEKAMCAIFGDMK